MHCDIRKYYVSKRETKNILVSKSYSLIGNTTNGTLVKVKQRTSFSWAAYSLSGSLNATKKVTRFQIKVRPRKRIFRDS